MRPPKLFDGLKILSKYFWKKKLLSLLVVIINFVQWDIFSGENTTASHCCSRFLWVVRRFTHSSLCSQHIWKISMHCCWEADAACSGSESFVTVGWGTKAQCFCLPYLKTWFFYLVFNAELNGTIKILCFRCTIIDLLWPGRAQLGNSRSIMVLRKHKILMVAFNSALKTK